jgi:hypothetical protein
MMHISTKFNNMIHPKTELKFISKDVGYGVVATEFIPMGTITWVLDKLDRVFAPEEVQNLDELYQNILDTYCFRNNSGQLVLCWDNARFVNHSFNSNCLSTAYDFEVAIRDIQPGEQLTDDYGYLNISEPFRGIDEGTKRKTVYPDDLVKYHRVWDKKILSVFKHIPQLEQPLAKLLPNHIWEKTKRIAKGNEEMDSILLCYYDGNQNGKTH